MFHRVPELRRPTLVAHGQDGTYRFDVVLHGQADELVLESKVDSIGTAEALGDDLQETVFLEFH